jgi:hypothetical protein
MKLDKAWMFLGAWRLLAPDAPEPIAEYQFAAPRRWRFDWVFIGEWGKVAVEVDGGVWLKFGGRHGSDKDREKMNAAAELGWRVFHYSPQMIEHDPAGVVEQVRRAIVVRVGYAAEAPPLPCKGGVRRI